MMLGVTWTVMSSVTSESFLYPVPISSFYLLALDIAKVRQRKPSKHHHGSNAIVFGCQHRACTASASTRSNLQVDELLQKEAADCQGITREGVILISASFAA